MTTMLAPQIGLEPTPISATVEVISTSMGYLAVLCTVFYWCILVAYLYRLWRPLPNEVVHSFAVAINGQERFTIFVILPLP